MSNMEQPGFDWEPLNQPTTPFAATDRILIARSKSEQTGELKRQICQYYNTPFGRSAYETTSMLTDNNAHKSTGIAFMMGTQMGLYATLDCYEAASREKILNTAFRSRPAEMADESEQEYDDRHYEHIFDLLNDIQELIDTLPPHEVESLESAAKRILYNSDDLHTARFKIGFIYAMKAAIGAEQG
jgi:hypothetical protein